jgi:UDP-N-acetylglucosamine 1-carboxyvinyltransferase
MSEQAFRIRGGQPLKGEIKAQRAKNAVLPMIAAALVPRKGKTVL